MDIESPLQDPFKVTFTGHKLLGSYCKKKFDLKLKVTLKMLS
jgi:hypothetical protein